jgi:hypothetical protein
MEETTMSENINTEATDEDVEGHTVRPRANDEDDTQGHVVRPRAADEDDVEGHVVRPRANDDDDDVEGHGISRPQ